ncbi:MAG: valine--tRNA ligase [Thermoleophilia bacterium]|nr:valine--tRNA ligase [Thermoleophilia bacterium]
MTGREPARYDPVADEQRWVDAWEASGVLRADPSSGKPPYTIAIPPPNVTGALHMGHALNNTGQDALIRHHRMAGYETMWICGTDHAGIATQAQVEKALARDGVNRRDIGREAFIERVWEWRAEYGGTIIGQLRRLGATLDYSRERFTMDEAYAKAVLRVFVDLYEKGHIYRDNYMVNWDPGLGSAISDLEVEDREVTDSLVRIAYPLTDGSGEVVVATVRPETMLGDTAVAVNPDDERYAHLVGRTVTLPLVGRELPVIADEYVKTDFGTGCLKITPAHDPNDFEIGRRHGLEAISVIGEDGRMTAAAGERYAGLTPAECAERVMDDLNAQGLLRGIEPYTHVVPYSHRSGARVEPLISLQWFCDMKALAEPAIAAVRDGRVRFTPARWGDVYLRWMDEIRPWCVSRQLWWGHQLPVWYRGDEVYVGASAPEGDGWTRDPDVLDTWFSSGLWPFATLGWPEDTPELERFYPTNVLSTARDIIFLWVARMMMMGLEFRGEVPFSDVYIHSVIQAPDGRRMSKSLGTGIDPLELIAEHGADALRFGLLLMSSQQDVRFSVDAIRQGRQLVTKLWNATRLVVARGGRAGHAQAPVPRTVADRWMAARVSLAVEEAGRLLAGYQFSPMAKLLYELVFDDYCDWYLELLKRDEATPEVAGDLLEQILALVHPVMPFVTEACWEQMPGAEGLMITHVPARASAGADAAAEAAVTALQEAVTAVRGLRNTLGLGPREPLRAAIDGDAVGPLTGAFCALAGVEIADDLPEDAMVVGTATGRLRVARAEGTVDVAAERERLTKDLKRAESEHRRAEGMLGNERFTSKAPPELVDAERRKAERFAAEAADLRARLEALGPG